MQDGNLNYPPEGTDWKYLMELRAEANYYGLTGLMQIIDRYPVRMLSTYPAWLHVQDCCML